MPDADPRVEAVAEALAILDNACVPENECFWECAESALSRMRDYAAVAVAALDAYDGPKFSSVVHECCERPTEADLRQKIVSALDHLWSVKRVEWKFATSYHEGYLDGIEHAARIITRGQ